MRWRFLGVLLAIGGLLFPIVSPWAASNAPTEEIKVDLGDTSALRRGARDFVNYCQACHSLGYVRYARVAKDLKITPEQMRKNLMFNSGKIADTMRSAMRPEEAVTFFAAAPPDLSVIARVRGADWLYSYLTGIYRDPARPSGVNNLVFKDVAMPHVLWSLQGWQKPLYDSDGDKTRATRVIGVELSTPGVLTEEAYRVRMKDLVSFLVYAGEPVAMFRKKLGVWILLFLLIFLALIIMLKREYWRDIS